MTSRKIPPFVLASSVRSYLNDQAIRTGVDALLGVKQNSLPPDLLPEELADYYAARGAAEMVRFDWAATLLSLWNATWGVAIGPAWKPASLATLVKEGYAVTPAACWDDDAMCFYHKSGQHFLATAVSIDSHETVLAFWYQKGNNKALGSFDKFVSKEHDEWDDEWMLQRFPFGPSSPKFALEKLTAAARLAAAEADRLAGIKK